MLVTPGSSPWRLLNQAGSSSTDISSILDMHLTIVVSHKLKVYKDVHFVCLSSPNTAVFVRLEASYLEQALRV